MLNLKKIPHFICPPGFCFLSLIWRETKREKRSFKPKYDFQDKLLSCLFLARMHDGASIRWGRVFTPFFFIHVANKIVFMHDNGFILVQTTQSLYNTATIKLTKN